jgi:hypothetical protein
MHDGRVEPMSKDSYWDEAEVARELLAAAGLEPNEGNVDIVLALAAQGFGPPKPEEDE